MELTRLYRKGKKGETLIWEVRADGEDIVVTHGQLGGKLQESRKAAKPKNVGKSNETTAEEQAKKEAQALWEAKLTRKYSKTLEEAQEEVFLPMLAHKYTDKAAIFPGDSQPKLDGVRALGFWDNKGVKIISRSGREYKTVPHINAQLEKTLPKKMVIDGELYLHGASFQEITRLVKKQRPESKNISFHVYDVPRDENGESNIWEGRREVLESLDLGSSIQIVETFRIEDKEALDSVNAQYLANKYEGGIFRNLEGEYLFGQRSRDLLKIKSFDDAEFKVVGVKEGEGRLRGTPIWLCMFDDDGTFEVTPKGSLEERAEAFKNANSYMGKFLKVTYFGFTEDKKPRFPIGEGFRLEKDN